MRIGILGGTGPAGSGLAARLASIGYDAVIGSRSKYRAMEARDSLVEQCPDLGDRLQFGDNAAGGRCRPRRDRHAVGLGGDRRRRSTTTALQGQDRRVDGERPRPRRRTSSSRSCRHAARWPPTCRPRCPDCRVVAAFHHLPAKELGNLGEPIDSDVLICGDDPDAVAQISEIVAKIPGCRPLDAGELSNAMAIEAFTAVLLQLNVRYKTRVAPKLTGIKRDPRAPKEPPRSAPAESSAPEPC